MIFFEPAMEHINFGTALERLYGICRRLWSILLMVVIIFKA